MLLLLCAGLASQDVDAAARFARTTGNWTAITWGTSCAAGNTGVPAAADDVTICNGVTVTVNNSPTVASISMPAGGTNTVLQITSAQTLTVNGDVTMVAGTGSGDHRQLLLSNGASLVVSGNVSLSGNGSDNRYALLQITGSSATIGGNLVIDGVAAGADRARVVMANTSNLTVGGSITLDIAGQLDNGNNGSVIQLGGNFTHVDATGNYSSSGGEFRFTGTGAQALNGGTGITTTFSRLTIDKPSGDVTINHPAQVANGGTLTLTSGRIVTGASYVGVGVSASATITGANADSYVVGNLRRYIPTGTQSGILFPVGGSTAGKFAQVQIDFPNVSTAGTFQVAASTGNTDHPNIGQSAIDAASSVNRYWTLTNSGSINYAAAGASITFNYPAGDVDGGAATSQFFVGDYGGSTWAYPTVGTLTATSSQVTGVVVGAIAGDYAIGEMQGPYSYWRMNEASWNGTAGEVIDYGSGGNPATATTLAGARPNTANASPAPAIGGSPGTCRYGAFTRANKNYLALPSTYPALAAAGQPGFSITAWIYPTNSALPGQRIMIDDQNDTSPGAWGFSVGETDRAGAGGVRFYYRQATTVTIDTVPVPSNQWLFVALSVSLAAGTNASSGTIYVYNTAGTLVTSYTQAFTWTAGSDPGPPSIGGETNASAEGNNAFGFSGGIDELRVFRVPLSQAMVNRVRQLVNPCEATDHYALGGNATGVTCDASTVQITAHDATHSAVSPSAGTLLTLSTSTGTGVWQAGLVAGAGTWTPSGANNGSATYVWPGGESTFTIRLRQNAAATLNINLLDANGKAESATEDLAIAFSDSAFRVTADGTSTGAIGTQISGKNSNTGFGAQTLYLQAIRTDTSTGSCVGVFQSQTVSIEMAGARINPTGSASQLSVLNSGGTMTALGTGAGAAGAYTSVSLAFDAQSKAPLVVNYPNAGSVSLFARYQLPAPPGGTYISGTSNAFVVRPFGLRISGPPNGRTGAGSTVYARAGATWPDLVTVSAVAWAAGEDANNDGIPDSDAVLAGNAVTTNFGAESTPATAAVTHALAEPSGGSSGTLTAALSAFTNGVATASASWSEVGLINLFATSTSYLGTGQNVRNSGTGYTGVGRFIPYDFAVARNTPMLQPACASGNFTYVGQPFNYATVPVLTVTARNQAGATTQNYAGSFWKVTAATLTGKSYSAATGTLDVTGIPGTDPVIGYNGDGVTVPQPSAGTGTLTFSSGTGLFFTRSTPVAPFNAEISLAMSVGDADSVTVASIDGSAALNPVRFGVASAGNGIAFSGGAKAMRFGRLRLQSANGSERLALPVRVEAQHWDGNGFIVNALDSCTPLVAGNVALGNYRGNLASGETTASVASAIASGVGSLRFSAPGAGNNGSVDVSVNLGATTAGASCLTGMAASTAGGRPWLQGAWCGAAYDDDPSARVTFGIYRTADRVIHQRENY
jgi:MSHA biogenesis protein MshQ